MDVEFRSGTATSRTDSKRVSTSHGESASLNTYRPATAAE
jgi:hypothetical protein